MVLRARFHSTSPDEKLLVASNGRNQVRLLDLATSNVVRMLDGPVFSQIAFSPDSKKLICPGGFDPRVLVWDVASGKMVHELKSHTNFVDRVVVSPDGSRLASAARDAAARGDYDIRLWDMATGRLIHRLTPQRGSAFDMQFSPDSRRLVTVGGLPGEGNDRGEVQLWEVASGKIAKSFEGHKERVTCIAFSPDGRMIATASIDRTLRLWEVASGQERHRIEGDHDNVSSVPFSPDGRLLAAASSDAAAYLWDVYGNLTLEQTSADLSPVERNRLWNELAAEDARTGFQAVRRLIALSDEAVPFLRDRLKPATPLAEEKARPWLDDLNSATFALREKASKELERLAEPAIPHLRRAASKAPSEEVRRRLEKILNKLDSMTAYRRQAMRTIEVLERIATPRYEKPSRTCSRSARGLVNGGSTRGARTA